MTPVTQKPATHKHVAAAEKALAKPKVPAVKPKEEKKIVEGPNGSTKGITWGLNLTATLRRLMEEQPKKKLDDERLIDFLLKEFPNRENKNILRNPREIRWRYNFGKLHEDKDGKPHAPEVQVLRYNPDGTVYAKTVKAKMSAEEKAMKIEERRELEVERRAAELESLAKAEERVTKLREKITARQTEWEKRNGVLPSEKPKAEAKKPKFTVKKK